MYLISRETLKSLKLLAIFKCDLMQASHLDIKCRSSNTVEPTLLRHSICRRCILMLLPFLPLPNVLTAWWNHKALIAMQISYYTNSVEKISLGIAYLGAIDTNSTNTLEEFTYSSPFDKENPTITKRCYEEKDEVNITDLFSWTFFTFFCNYDKFFSQILADCSDTYP